jgi:dihydroorotate dehydrogenase
MTRWLASAMARTSLPLLRKLDAERAHDLGLEGLRFLRPMWPTPSVPSNLRVRCFGLDFAHPLGLAAGFDKNGDYLDALGAVGFGHIELGTVTPRPQPGNPKPRMFRVPETGGLVNRMGFNNKGVDHLLAQLAAGRYPGIRGISIGKNADTPIEDAQNDYVACLRKVYGHAHYIAVNVSSPNTARLRELQAPDGLERILGALLEERRVLQERNGKRVPLLVKIAPNLDADQVKSIAGTLRSLEVEGVIATNTSNDLSGLGAAWPETQRGGLSGAPIHSLSLNVIAQLRAELGAGVPIIGVGGIVTAQHALATLAAGANLIQIYTGFANQGHRLVEDILHALSARPTPAGSST